MTVHSHWYSSRHEQWKHATAALESHGELLSCACSLGPSKDSVRFLTLCVYAWEALKSMDITWLCVYLFGGVFVGGYVVFGEAVRKTNISGVCVGMVGGLSLIHI